nr:type I-E CRISPR-associated protein Cse1/CasA [uncultured Peptostreptococcus sp.]
MGRYNLLDEPWISVVVDKKGNTNEVSMLEFFEHAHEYLDFGGDTKTQDFAVMRVLLAVIHTVFSRFDAEGEAYEYFDLDERYRPRENIDSSDLEDYEDDLYDTWISLWEDKKFPEVVKDYLEKWRDRFFLYDEEYPFFQVTKNDVISSKLNKTAPSDISGKKINRRISESNNKVALFSPKYDDGKNKEILTDSEVARWLITYQGYTGLDDKVAFGKDKYKSSKGWLFDIGGIYIRGENLFETLILNTVLVNKEEKNLEKIQLPSWEISSEEYLNRNLNTSSDKVDTSASLLTTWSRAIFMEANLDIKEPFSFGIVKLPDVKHQNKFLESMTIWQYNKTGDNKGTFTPRKHQANKAIWRSFGLITGLGYSQVHKDECRKPGVIEWINTISDQFEVDGLKDRKIKICSVSMQDDGNATSWVPTDEILDIIDINESVLTDENWAERINQSVEITKKIVGFVYKKYIEDIKSIRNINTSSFVESKVEDMYYRIDSSFRLWLSSIKYDDKKDAKILEWNKKLKILVIQMADEILESAGDRDFKGIVVDEKVKNIATAYNKFIFLLNKELISTKEAMNNGED